MSACVVIRTPGASHMFSDAAHFGRDMIVRLIGRKFAPVPNLPAVVTFRGAYALPQSSFGEDGAAEIATFGTLFDAVDGCRTFDEFYLRLKDPDVARRIQIDQGEFIIAGHSETAGPQTLYLSFGKTNGLFASGRLYQLVEPMASFGPLLPGQPLVRTPLAEAGPMPMSQTTLPDLQIGRGLLMMDKFRIAPGKWGSGAAGYGVGGHVDFTKVTARDIKTHVVRRWPDRVGHAIHPQKVVLHAGQTNPAENGPYIVVASGTAGRHPEFVDYDSIAGAYFSVMEGDSHPDSLWRCTSDAGGTIGVTDLELSEFPSGGATDTERQNFGLSLIYQSKFFAECRRLIHLFATGFKGASDTLNGIATAASANYSVDASSGRVTPTAVTTQVQINPFSSDSAQSTAITIVDMTTSIPNGRVVERIGVYSTSARTISIKIYQSTSNGAGTVVVNQSVSHPGGGWSDFTLSSSYTIPGSGTFYLAVGEPAGTLSFTSSVSRTFFSGDSSGSVTGGSTIAGVAFPSRYNYQNGVNNMTLVTTAQTADSSVSNGRVLLEFNPVDSITLDTDLTAEVTCDGGANWSPAPLWLVGTSQGGLKVAETADAACTAGTAFQARVKTLNNKNIHIYGTSLTVH